MNIMEQRISDTKIEVQILLAKTGKCAILRPTGFGKTTMICDIAKGYSNILYVYPNQAIRDMAEAKLCGKNVDWVTYYYLGLNCRSGEEARRLINNEYDLIIFDEIHHMGADNTKVAISNMLSQLNFKSTHILGGTATPIRSDSFDVVSEFFDNNITSFYGLDNLIEDRLVPAPYYVYASQGYEVFHDIIVKKGIKLENNKHISEKRKADARVNLRKCDTILSRMLNTSQIIKETVDTVYGNQTPTYMKFIVFFSNKKTLSNKRAEVFYWFTSAFSGHKVNRPLIIHSDTEERDNIKRLPELKEQNNTIDLIFCIDMLNEGYHVDNLTGCILLRPTKSNIVYTQQIGRCMHIGMLNTPIIIDLVENLDTKSIYGMDFSKRGRSLSNTDNQKVLLNMISIRHIRLVDKIADVRKVLKKLDSSLPDDIDELVLEARKNDMVAYQILLYLQDKGLNNIKLWQVLQVLDRYSTKLKSLGLEIKDCDRYKRGIEGEEQIDSFDKQLDIVNYRVWSEWVGK